MAQSTTVTGTAVDAVPGSLSERAADRLAALTGQAADVPTVVLSLVHGDRLDMIGGFGVPSSWRSISDVPMSGTLSGLVLSTGFPVVMEDVTLDRRLAEHAGLRRSGTRAYLGFPIHGQDDEPVGVCAAVDFRPRIWTADEMRAVDHAAQACTALVAKQRARQEIDRQRRFLDAILESLHVGVAACDPSGRITLFNAALRTLIGDQRPGADAAGWARQLPLRHPDGSPLAADEVPLLRALRGDPVRD